MFRAPMLILVPILIIVSISLFAREPSIPPRHPSLLIPGDTVYLDWNGNRIRIKKNGKNDKEVKNITDTGHAIIFLIRTICRDEDIYGPVGDTVNDENARNGIKFRGKSNPIDKWEAKRTKALIRDGRCNEALASGNLIELVKFDWRKGEWEYLQKDDGGGDTLASNNREYLVYTWVTKKQGKILDSQRVKMDRIYSPCDLLHPSPEIKTFLGLISIAHTHPSGTNKNKDGNPCFFSQPPSKEDIKSAPVDSTRVSPAKFQYWTVYAMADRKVFLFDKSGIIGIVPIKTYIK
jgi:hypothetical protein